MNFKIFGVQRAMADLLLCFASAREFKHLNVFIEMQEPLFNHAPCSRTCKNKKLFLSYKDLWIENAKLLKEKSAVNEVCWVKVTDYKKRVSNFLWSTFLHCQAHDQHNKLILITIPKPERKFLKNVFCTGSRFVVSYCSVVLCYCLKTKLILLLSKPLFLRGFGGWVNRWGFSVMPMFNHWTWRMYNLHCSKQPWQGTHARTHTRKHTLCGSVL